jgi:hypothetical protein
MTRMPVTVADQGLALWPEDVDELVDLLTDAAAVIGALAGSPAAEAALGEAGAAGLDSCTDLAIDLRLAAARLDEETTACRINDQVTKGRRKYADAQKNRSRHAAENQHSEEGQW